MAKAVIPPLLSWLALVCSVSAQLTNPVPDPLPAGLSVKLEPWLAIPARPEDTTFPNVRINHLKPCPGGTRLFCNNLNGRLWVIAGPSASAATEFLNIADYFPAFIRVTGLGTGFTSFAFHPEFATPGAPGHGKFYTAHSENASGGNVDFSGPLSAATSQIGTLVEWTMNDPAANAITPANHTRRTLLRIGFPHNFHDMQEIAFNPVAMPGDEDYGCLFLCVGDGGSLVVTPAVPGNIGRIDSPLGAIHRIVPVLESAAGFALSANGQYYIPSTNPHAAASDPTPGEGFPVVREMFANGFRNPHRISWDAGGSHKMFCGNIGEVQVEEVELIEKGRNYGWPAREGSYQFLPADPTHVYPLSPSPDVYGVFTYPVAQYDHATGFAIVGGHVYRGSAIPELFGKYICGDVVNGKLWIADEDQMNLQPATATGSAPALLRELGVKSGTTPTTLLAMLGKTRADLRFGIDHAGELYVLSKQNGTIYRVKRDGDPVVPPLPGNLATWSAAGEDFEDGKLDGISISFTGSNAEIVNDPVLGASNRVLRFQNPGTITSFAASFPVPEIADGEHGTLHFRFLVPDQNHDISFGLSDVAQPTAFGDFEVQLQSSANSGTLQVRNAGTVQTAVAISPGIWHTVIAHIDNTTDRWNLYLTDSGAPALVKSNIVFRNGTASALRSFFIRSNTTGGANISPIYLDDIRIDPGHANLTDPLARDWEIVDHFDGPDPLEAWELSGNPQQSATIAAGPDGDRYFRHAATSDAAAARALPFEIPVGGSFTTFFRLRLEEGTHHFGAAAQGGVTTEDFEPHLRISPTGIDLHDGIGGAEDFITTPVPPLVPGVWHKLWIVADNRVWASGGQRWQAFLQTDADPQPVALSEPLFFRKSAESTISRFLTIASDAAVHLDDIHVSHGTNLTDPVGKTWIPLALQRSENQITLSHATRVNRFFQFFESDDLQDWPALTAPAEGDGNLWALDRTFDHPRRFFRAARHSRRAFHTASWSGLDGMTLVRPATSTWTASPGKLTLALTSAQPHPVVSGMIARPGSYALAPGDWRNSDIRLAARTLRTAATANRDVVIVFGYIDSTRYYYAHFSAVSDGTAHTVIMKVTGANSRSVIQTPLTVSPAPFTSLAATDFRVTHSAAGEIAIYAGNLELPFMTASDATFPAGRVGFGSFDDPAEFLEFSVTGEQR